MRIYLVICGIVLLASCNPNYDTPQGKSKRSLRDKNIPAEETTPEFKNADEMAEFPGGMPALQQYLGQHIHYPESARNAGIGGKVYVEFVIDERGKPGNIKIKRGVTEGLDNECIRVISEMPAWNPARKKGEPIPQRYVLPVNFKLDE